MLMENLPQLNLNQIAVVRVAAIQIAQTPNLYMPLREDL
jgi:hypothetical protein